MEDDQELQNPFPSPPSHYSDYSSHNLRLLSLLKSRLNDDGLGSTDLTFDTVEKQHKLLSNEKDVPDWPLTRLEKPRVDWILEDGVYNAFGDTWFVSALLEHCACLRTFTFVRQKSEYQLCLRWAAHSYIQRIPLSVRHVPFKACLIYILPPDRRPALQAVLRTVLHTYTSFLSSILQPPPSQTSDVPPDWQRLVEWMRIMAQNIMGAANDLRPVQVSLLQHPMRFVNQYASRQRREPT
jgi:mediator of RNA polymerase II transcription subunit 7